MVNEVGVCVLGAIALCESCVLDVFEGGGVDELETGRMKLNRFRNGEFGVERALLSGSYACCVLMPGSWPLTSRENWNA